MYLITLIYLMQMVIQTLPNTSLKTLDHQNILYASVLTWGRGTEETRMLISAIIYFFLITKN